jgi:hypothetical protein
VPDSPSILLTDEELEQHISIAIGQVEEADLALADLLYCLTDELIERFAPHISEALLRQAFEDRPGELRAALNELHHRHVTRRLRHALLGRAV